MAYYRKKPVIIEAFRFGFDEAPDWWVSAHMDKAYRVGDDVFITTLEGEMKVGLGDWVIKGVAGELYPCKNDIFLKTYDKAVEVGDTIARENHVVADWKGKEWTDPVGFLDDVMSEYETTYGRTPDAAMAKSVEKCQMMLMTFWYTHREEIRRHFVELEERDGWQPSGVAC